MVSVEPVKDSIKDIVACYSSTKTKGPYFIIPSFSVSKSVIIDPSTASFLIPLEITKDT